MTAPTPAPAIPAAPARSPLAGHPLPGGSLCISIPRKNSPGIGALCRDLVEQGIEDQPAEVWLDGVRCLTVRSIYAAALTTISEEPVCRHVPYTPHPKAEIGPRMQALIERSKAEREARVIDRRLRKEYGA